MGLSLSKHIPHQNLRCHFLAPALAPLFHPVFLYLDYLLHFIFRAWLHRRVWVYVLSWTLWVHMWILFGVTVRSSSISVIDGRLHVMIIAVT